MFTKLLALSYLAIAIHTSLAAPPVIRAGEVNTFPDGRYDWVLLTAAHSGAPEHPTVLVAEHQGQAVILPKSWGWSCGIYAADDVVIHDLVIDGFVIEGADVSAVHFWNSARIRVRNCEMRKCRLSGLAFHNCDHVTVENCLIEDNGLDKQSHGIYADGTEIVIRNCTVRNNSGWGVHFWPVCSSCVVDSNLIYGNKGYGVVVAHSSNPPASERPNRVTRNMIFANDGGIQIHRGNDDVVTKNAVYSNTSGYWITLNAAAVHPVTIIDNAHGEKDLVFDPAKKARVSNGAVLDIGPMVQIATTRPAAAPAIRPSLE